MFEKLKTIICEEFEVNEEEITPETVFWEIGMDSLDMVDLVMSIEDEFRIEVTDEALESFRIVADVVKYLESEYD